ncbi:MAG TPA: M28 family metallopeptidase [Gemmatimonadaceae bacterium]|nr:M28 family metallopeptidase [Gemmatimonadaceae bacterium]
MGLPGLVDSIMRAFLSRISLVLLPAAFVAAEAHGQALADRYREHAARIVSRALRDSAAWQRIATLTETFGSRFSGSEGLERAIDWTMAEMRRDGLDNVRGEPVMVPRWVRGAESAELVAPRRQALPMLGLGGSIATPPGGITADVMVVRSFDDLRARAAQARGKILLFNVPFTTYGETVQYRSRGAVEAARAGAVASLIRSVTPYSMRTPHTGGMAYDSTVQRIPHAAITPEDADMIERMIARGQRVSVRLTMSAQTLPDAPSRNVVGELRGRERPDEIVVMGGHIDSWDVGRGAMDDAGGVVAAWEAVRILKELGLVPRRTIRVVGWTNEENGLRGANAYRDAHRPELERHVLAIESDAGVFKPAGFGFTGSDSAYALVRQVGTLLESIGAGTITRGGGGADIGPIMALGVPGMGLTVDGTRYFWYHHTDADTVDKLDPHEVALCVATMAVMAYVIADMPETLPRGPGS